MNFKSKFEFNQQVVSILLRQEKQWILCGFCSGSGRITGADKADRTCPACYGNKGRYKYQANSWQVCETLTIGEIRIKSRCAHEALVSSPFDNYSDQTAQHSEDYMCYETGIGSGTVWSVDRLFFTETEALAACDKLNKELQATD